MQNISLSVFGILHFNLELAKDIDVLAKVQRRGTKLISFVSALPYESRFEKLGIHSQHKGIDLIKVFRLLNSHYQIYLEDISTLRKENITRGNPIKLFKQTTLVAIF